MRRFVTPLRLRSLAGGNAGRKVTWLELFFDLIFVAAVSQVAGPLHEHYSVDGLVRFVPLFVLIWWAWTGHAVFSTPVALIVMIATLCVTQLVVSLAGTSPTRRLAHATATRHS